MSDPTIPAEAVQAAAEAIELELTDRSFDPFFKGDEALARRMVEAAAPFIAEHIAAEIERVVVSGNHPRPKYERGGFFNDASWAARLAREAFPKETPDAE